MHPSHTLLLWWLCVLAWLCRSACSFTSTAVCLFFYFSNSDLTLCSDLFSPKLSRIFCQSTVTLCVCMCMYVCGCLHCTDADLSRWPALSVCWFPAALQLKLKHLPVVPISSCSHRPEPEEIISAQLPNNNKAVWMEKTSARSPTQTYMNPYKHLAHPVSVMETPSLCFFLNTLPPGNTLSPHKKKETNFTEEITSILSSGKSFS